MQPSLVCRVWLRFGRIRCPVRVLFHPHAQLPDLPASLFTPMDKCDTIHHSPLPKDVMKAPDFLLKRKERDFF